MAACRVGQTGFDLLSLNSGWRFWPLASPSWGDAVPNVRRRPIRDLAEARELIIDSDASRSGAALSRGSAGACGQGTVYVSPLAM